jgi:EAL domain-containing protein (putative c-di-GMP-specific phosphodiesterase class I)
MSTYPQNVTFELVESEGINNFEDVERFIQQIKSYGCSVAIDDFGTGYSNFEYLLKLQTDTIKIDGSLIKDIDTNQDKYDIVQTIVSFAKIKKLKVVAEFVSSESIYKTIQSLGIDLCQGYYFGEPKPFD